MKNNKELYTMYEKERENDRAVPEFNLIKFMEAYKRNVDFYNTYGLKPKTPSSALKKPLT
jgi:hypothetical protein